MVIDNRRYSDMVLKLFMRELEVMDEGKNPVEYLQDRFSHILMSHTKFMNYIHQAVQEFYANYW